MGEGFLKICYFLAIDSIGHLGGLVIGIKNTCRMDQSFVFDLDLRVDFFSFDTR